MTVPYVPGDRPLPAKWWTEHDEAILRGELEKLDALPSTALPRRSTVRPPWWRRPYAWGIAIMYAVMIAVAVLAACAAAGSAPAAPGPIVTPATYGPPNPNGGAR